MSTMISKEQLIQNIKLALGHPVIDIELENSNYEYAIDRALNWYQRYAVGNAITQDHLILQVASGVTGYDMPANVVAVLESQYQGDYLAGSVAELFSFENVLWNQGSLNVWNWGNFGLVTYEMSLQYLDLIKQMIPSKWTIQYLRRENRLTIQPAPVTSGVIFLSTYRSIAPSAIYDSQWVLEWAIAEAKEMLGRIRGKYVSLPGAGGNVQLDGPTLLQEARIAKDELKQRIKTAESQALGFFCGGMALFLAVANYYEMLSVLLR